GQSTGFVREDVFDLTKLFDQTGSSAYGGGIRRFVVNIEIAVNEECMVVFDNFHGDEQTRIMLDKEVANSSLHQPYRHQVGVKNPVSQNISKELFNLVVVSE